MKAILYLGQNVSINKYDLSNSYLIGVDNGALILAKNNIHMDLAVGDFDTAGEDRIDFISSFASEVIKLNKEKDDTDTMHAIDLIYSKFDEILVIGGLSGKRVDHLIANICILNKYPTIKFIDDDTCMYLICKDKTITKTNYKYISFFALEDSIISLSGFKYNIDNYSLKLYNPLAISNEIISSDAKIKVKGKILCIESKNDNIN